MNPKCKTCKSFDKSKNITSEVNGQCKINPPSTDNHNKWPHVKGDSDWCMKHELKKKRGVGNFWG